MIPILFPYDAVDFSSHGIGDLMDTISCTTELNEDGEYELELEYPADGKYIHELMIDNLIYAKADDHGPYQAFRIYSIEKAINSLVTVHAQHISYDLSCYPVKAYEAKTCHTAVTYLIPYAISQEVIPFSITTDVTEEAQNEDRKFKLEEPKSVRAALLDGDDSIKGTFGGDLVFDNFNVSLKKVGGADRGVLVEYGIDLIDMDQEENISEMVTGVYPYWKGRDLTRDEDGNYIEHTDKDGETIDKIIYGSVQYAAGTFKRHRVIPLNITEYCVNLFDAEGNDREPTVSEINQIARDWIEANEIGEPEISLTVSYADLKKDVRMHDAITVRFVKLGIDVKAKVVSYKYDTLKERCIQVTVGKAKPSILFDLEDASRLKRGLIPPKRIQNRSITSEKIETRAITPDVIDNNAIQAQHIEPEAVQSLQLDTAVQEQLGYAELFHAATLKPADIDVEALPEYFSSKELRVVDADGNLLTEMSSDGLSSFNFNILDGDGNSAISMQNSGSIHAKNIYASVIIESPKYSFPVAEGAAEQTVNQHTHALTADDDGKVHIGAPDFKGEDHFFNIADTKFYKDKMSAFTYTISANSQAGSIMQYPYQEGGINNNSKALIRIEFDIDGHSKTVSDDIDVTQIYRAGQNSVPTANYTISANSQAGSIMQYPYQEGGINNNSKALIRIEFDIDGHSKTVSDDIDVTQIYRAGQNSVPTANYTISANSQAGSIMQYPYQEGGINNNSKALIRIAFDIDGHSKTVSDDIDVTQIYRAGQNSVPAANYTISANSQAGSIMQYPYQEGGINNNSKALIRIAFDIDGHSKTVSDDIDVTQIYRAGQNSVPAANYTISTDSQVGSIMQYPYQEGGISNKYKALLRIEFDIDGHSKTVSDDINVTDIYEAGKNSVPVANYTISTDSQTGSITQYPYKEGGINNNSKALISITFDIDGHSKTVSDDINVTGIYNVGYDTGLGSATIDTNYSKVTINDSHFTQYNHHYIKVTVGGRATGTYSDNTTFYSTAGNILNEYKILADDVYEAGKAAGGGSSGGIQYGYCTTNVETMYNEWTNVAEGKTVTFMVWDANNHLIDSKVENIYYP